MTITCDVGQHQMWVAQHCRFNDPLDHLSSGGLGTMGYGLPAAIGANARGKGLICPAESGAEAAWAGEDIEILAPRSLIAIANHFRGTQVLSRPKPAMRAAITNMPDMADIKGQETAKDNPDAANQHHEDTFAHDAHCRRHVDLDQHQYYKDR